MMMQPTDCLPVACGACGWSGKRKPGAPVTCPKCGAMAAFQWVPDPAPRKVVEKQMTIKRIPIPPALQRELDADRQEFIAKFGREPMPSDPLIWDPDSDTPVPISEEKLTAIMVAGMREAGIPYELIYAFEKTGRIMTADNMHLMAKQDRRDFTRAVKEGLRRKKMGET